MRIDLHCHTKATKNGGEGRNVTPERFAKKIDDAQVKIVAITNHNEFDKDQFEKLKEAVSDDVSVWPGVELDVTFDDANPWHMLVIVNPEQVDTFNDKMTKLRGNTSLNKCKWNFENIWDEFKNLDAFFVSHCHDKKPCITDKAIENLNKIVADESWRFYYEPRTLLTLGIWSNHGFNMMLGSDVRDWDQYENSEFVELRLDVDSFNQFYLLAKRDQQIVQTLLNKKTPQAITVQPHPKVCIDVNIFEDVNVIFGQKGTGKSEIINSFENYFVKEKGIKPSIYRGGTKYEEYKKWLEIDPTERDCSSFDRTDGHIEISKILEWQEEQPTPVSNYYDWFDTIGNNEKKDAFKLSESQALPPIDTKDYEAVQNDKRLVTDFSKEFTSKDLGKYLDKKDANSFDTLLKKLLSKLEQTALQKFIEEQATSLANTAIGQIKNIIDKKSDTLSKPDDTGFLKFVNNRVQLLSLANTILDNIAPNEKETYSYLGKLEGKGELYILLKKRYLCSSSRTEEFSIGINKLKNWKKALEKVKESYTKADLLEKLASFIEAHEDTNITDLSDFIGLEKYTVRGKSDERYEPSDGEKGILVLEKMLSEDTDVFLLDEPELGMGNLYIDSVIRPRIIDLAKLRKTIIIATHNANLAVRTLPYTSIYREHVQGDEYETFIGNPFLNRLVNVADNQDTKSWSEVSMETLEGGKEAFYDRERIYKAGNNENQNDSYKE